MTEDLRAGMADICGRIAGKKLPRWRELPDFELYMDQVLALVAKYLGDYPAQDAKTLTAAMVNNYVKMGVTPAPVKRKYSRRHLAYLLILCVLKPVLPIASIREVLRREAEESGEEHMYDRFCELFEQINASVAESASRIPEEESPASALKHTMYCAALRAQAESAVAAQALVLLCPPEAEKSAPGKEKTPHG